MPSLRGNNFTLLLGFVIEMREYIKKQNTRWEKKNDIQLGNQLCTCESF